MTAVLDILLDLALLPARGWIAELGIEQVMADHGAKAQVDVAQLALAHPVDGRLHVVVDAAARDPAPRHKGMVMGIEQHLVGLQQVGAQEEGPTVAQLELGHLQLGALAGDDGPVLAPVELEGLTLGEAQGDVGAAARRSRLLLLFLTPATRERRDSIIGTREAQSTQIGMDLLERASLLTRLVGLGLEPRGELGGMAVELARALPCGVGGCCDVSAQIAPDRIPGNTQASGDLAQRDLVAKMPASNDAQYGHVDHSELPLVPKRASVLYVGQHSMQIPAVGGSGFSANQQVAPTAGAIRRTRPIHRVMKARICHRVPGTSGACQTRRPR